MLLKEGLELKKSYTVSQEHSAKHVGSGELMVLSTPSMIAFMEETALLCAQQGLNSNETTVGTHLDVYHIAPAPVNEEIQIYAKLLKIDGRKLVFWVEAKWKDKIIGYGIHERFVVDKQKFLAKI